MQLQGSQDQSTAVQWALRCEIKQAATPIDGGSLLNF